jgi:hypothetical protein
MSRYDVLVIDQASMRVTVGAFNLDESNADAWIKTAVMRRGTETEIFATTAVDSYMDGDEWKGERILVWRVTPDPEEIFASVVSDNPEEAWRIAAEGAELEFTVSNKPEAIHNQL